MLRSYASRRIFDCSVDLESRRGPWHDWAIAVGPSVGAVTPLSHSRTHILIEGAAARQVLSMGIALDFHPQAFPVNGFALTGLHHTPIRVHRSGAVPCELYALRSFALWTWEWLTDAALQRGYEIVEPT